MANLQKDVTVHLDFKTVESILTLLKELRGSNSNPVHLVLYDDGSGHIKLGYDSLPTKCEVLGTFISIHNLSVEVETRKEVTFLPK